MKTLILWFTLLAFGGAMTVAEAKRFGGGGSFGFSKKVAPKSYTPKKAAAKPASQPAQGKAAAGAAASSGASRWLGPLAGFAAGGLIAAMIFGDGFEGFQAFDFFLIAIVAFMLFSLFKRRQATGQGANQARSAAESYGQPRETPSDYRQQQQAKAMHTESQVYEAYNPHSGHSIIGSGLSESAHNISEIPAWFNEVAFVEGAKGHFVALQKAWDSLDVAEIKSYCSAELFEAIQVEMQTMQPGENHTELEDLNAEVAAMAVDGDYFVVSIRFSGFIKEGIIEMSHAFSEIWHIRRDASDQGNWEVAGIQQTDEG